MDKHRDEIIDQFSKQAIPFTKVPGHMDSMQLLIKLSEVGADDSVLDVACGPGLVACEFAKHGKHVTGIDITPAMIEQAVNAQNSKGLINMSWDTGEAYPLPYADGSFDLVITRYSFHHFRRPWKALKEMIRVCRTGGRVLAADVAVKPEHSEDYDALEMIRDPSHVHALTTAEFQDMFQRSGLKMCTQSGYGIDIEVESQIRASFPAEGGEAQIREIINGDIGRNSLGINARRQKEEVWYTVPIAVYTGVK